MKYEIAAFPQVLPAKNCTPELHGQFVIGSKEGSWCKLRFCQGVKSTGEITAPIHLTLWELRDGDLIGRFDLFIAGEMEKCC